VLEDSDDVQNVLRNFDIPEAMMSRCRRTGRTLAPPPARDQNRGPFLFESERWYRPRTVPDRRTAGDARSTSDSIAALRRP